MANINAPSEKWGKVTLKLDLPAKGLFWNRRTHHYALAALKKQSRRLGYMAADEVISNSDIPELIQWKGYLFEPHYPNARRHDDDSLIHASKGLLDGIFNDYLKVDDSRVRSFGCERTVERGVKPFMYLHLYYEEL